MRQPDGSPSRSARLAEVFTPGKQISQHDELCLQLATLRRNEAREASEKQVECEALLNEAVELRAERRWLQEEQESWQRTAVLAQTNEDRCALRYGQAERLLQGEVQALRTDLHTASSLLRGVPTAWVLETDPMASLQEAEAECSRLSESLQQWTQARTASQELAARLQDRLTSLEDSLTSLSAAKEASRRHPEKKIDQGDLDKLRKEIMVLKARARVTGNDFNQEAHELWLARDKEIPRLRAAEYERTSLLRRLNDARYDRDRLARDYKRIIDGLHEQEVSQRASVLGLEASLHACRTEGEEMVGTMRENDERIAEMRQDRYHTETYVEHLSAQLARMEEERNTLKVSVQKPLPLGGALGSLDRDVQVQTLALLNADDHTRIEQLQEELARDKHENQALISTIAELERQLPKAETRVAELRTEVATLRPLLQSPSSVS